MSLIVLQQDPLFILPANLFYFVYRWKKNIDRKKSKSMKSFGHVLPGDRRDVPISLQYPVGNERRGGGHLLRTYRIKGAETHSHTHEITRKTRTHTCDCPHCSPVNKHGDESQCHDTNTYDQLSMSLHFQEKWVTRLPWSLPSPPQPTLELWIKKYIFTIRRFAFFSCSPSIIVLARVGFNGLSTFQNFKIQELFCLCLEPFFCEYSCFWVHFCLFPFALFYPSSYYEMRPIWEI